MAVALLMTFATSCAADVDAVPTQTTGGSSQLPQSPSTAPPSPSPSPPAAPPATPSAGGPTAAPTGATDDWPAYESSIEPVTAARLGPTWQPGCPVAPADLRLVTVTYATDDATARTGELVVAAGGAEDIVAVFAEIYAARFPITVMETIEMYGGDDDASMAADNTSAFNCRPVTGGDGWSRHAYGLAVDINPLRNPYVQGSTVLPPAGAAYLDRSDVRPGMIVAGGVVVRAFAERGFEWGGDFSSLKDYQHFDR